MKLLFPSHATIPTPERLVLRGGRLARVPLAVRYGVLLRPGEGPVLIDAGWPEPHAGDSAALRAYRRAMRARIDAEHAPMRTLERLGFAPGDVAHVLLTHPHADHVGTLRDFPGATLHGCVEAFRAARRGGLAALRHAIFAELIPPGAPERMVDLSGDVRLPHGLGMGRDVLGDGSVLSVELPGHAHGHFGFVFPRLDPPVLYAADAQWMLAAIRERRPPRGPARLVYAEPDRVEPTIERVDAFERAGGRVVLCHDPEPVGPFGS